MLPDRREFPCQIINMSPGGLALLAPGIGNVGDRVIAYLDHIGRVEGKITRIIDNGFAMTVGATARKRDKLAAQLTWLANRDILNLPEDRRHDRIIPRNPIALLTLEDGTKMTCRIIDMSRSGAWCAISRKVSRSNSSTSRSPRPSRTASPRGKTGLTLPSWPASTNIPSTALRP
jgi:hypothetical protein